MRIFSSPSTYETQLCERCNVAYSLNRTRHFDPLSSSYMTQLQIPEGLNPQDTQLQKHQISFLCVVTQMTREHLSLSFLTDRPDVLMTNGTLYMKCIHVTASSIQKMTCPEVLYLDI